MLSDGHTNENARDDGHNTSVTVTVTKERHWDRIELGVTCPPGSVTQTERGYEINTGRAVLGYKGDLADDIRGILRRSDMTSSERLAAIGRLVGE